MKKRKYPQEMLLMNGCPSCGQEVNRQFVENTIDEIVALAVAEERKRVVEWAKTKKDKLIMKWDTDKAKSTVYDDIIFGTGDYPSPTTNETR